jgi:6-phosphogluconolactonase (cycloisomerase 2 family)
MAIALARDSRLLFAANLADSTITSFTLNSSTGELTAVGVPVASGGTMGSGALVVDDDENFLFAGNNASGDISVFDIAADGGLTPVGVPFSLGVATGTNGMTMNAVGTTLYVALPNTNQLAVLSVAADGTLSHIAGSPFAFEVESFVLATSTLGFSGVSSTGTIASYSIDLLGAPTLLDSIPVGSNNQCVTTARRGRLAILSGGGVASISVIAVAADGTLTPVVGSPFATSIQTNGYATVNPSGRHIYATERTQIEAFRMDSAGALTSIDTYELLPGFVGTVRATLTVIY